jgi:hypothetical protein
MVVFVRDFVKALNALSKEVSNKIKHVNSGGCCVFAAEVASILREIVPIRLLVSSPDYGDSVNYSLTDARPNVNGNNTVEGWNSCDIYFGHVFIELIYDGETYHYDSTGMNQPGYNYETERATDPAFGYDVLHGALSFTEAVELASCEYGWNSVFDREQIPKLRKIVRKHLQH